MPFIDFQAAVKKQFDKMSIQQMYRTAAGKDELWAKYLESFPDGTNPIYLERAEHDCQCCKQFIRAVGNAVVIDNGELVSIWDVKLDGYYGVVAKVMSDFVKSFPIENIFLYEFSRAGNPSSGGFDHFYADIPSKFVNRDPGRALGDARTAFDMGMTGFTNVTMEAIDIVLELIAAGSIYRGEEKRNLVKSVRDFKESFDAADNKSLFVWHNSCNTMRFKNDVIGTLLMDISEGRELDAAVASFEQKVAPANYQRPKAIATKGMIEAARKELTEKGLIPSLERRFATPEDISINNVIWASRSTKPVMKDVFDTLINEAEKTPKSFDRIEEIGIDDFIKNVLPTAKGVEVFFTNGLRNRIVSLVAPVTECNLFKWNNGFSWSYNGEGADSVTKQRVKDAGGSVEGVLCCRLSWDGRDDLDLHMLEGRYEIYYVNRRTFSPYGGTLDLDANGADGKRDDPAENIYYPNASRIPNGAILELMVKNYNGSSHKGFTVEIEFGGQTHTITYDKHLRDSAKITIAKILYRNGEFSIIESLPSTGSVKGEFMGMNMIMLSPNHWDGQEVGNKHFFFMLNDFKVDNVVRPFYNEFLSSDLQPHRKALEMIGAKLSFEGIDHQLSGIGFSSTVRASMIVRVTGATVRVMRVNF